METKNHGLVSQEYIFVNIHTCIYVYHFVECNHNVVDKQKFHCDILSIIFRINMSYIHTDVYFALSFTIRRNSRSRTLHIQTYIHMYVHDYVYIYIIFICGYVIQLLTVLYTQQHYKVVVEFRDDLS